MIATLLDSLVFRSGLSEVGSIMSEFEVDEVSCWCSYVGKISVFTEPLDVFDTFSLNDLSSVSLSWKSLLDVSLLNCWLTSFPDVVIFDWLIYDLVQPLFQF